MRPLLQLLFALSSLSGFSQNAWCGTGLPDQQAELESKINVESRSTITIPVVFHVLWKDSVENISDERIYSQLDVLNTDFRALNANLKVLSKEKQNLAADMQIEFCLAFVDPFGNPAKGITRKQTSIDNIGTQNTVSIPSKAFIKNSSLGGTDAWDTEKYLNIWIGKFQSNTILAESKFPWDTIRSEDGIRIDPEYVGIHCVDALKKRFSYGRTLTHEVGHYLGLLHPWSADCTLGDQVQDTPPQRNAYYDCNKVDDDECGYIPLVENFMQFSDDLCLALFTHDQKKRVDQMISKYRPKLLSNNVSCFPFYYPTELTEDNLNFYPNPSTGCVMVDIDLDTKLEIELEIFDATGRLIHQESNIVLSIRPIEINFLQSGMYFVRAKSNGKSVTKKIIVL